MRQPPRPRDEPIVTGWTLFRFLLIGTYIGFATVAGFVWWFLYYENGPHLKWNQLLVWSKCTPESFGGRTDITCDIFNSLHPNTIALSILVIIEMFQALNSLSESGSLFSRYAIQIQTKTNRSSSSF
jgi:magnesium-transporting ATPase (P-type)